MKITININDKQAPEVQEAFCREHGYQVMIPNPEPCPAPVLDKKGKVKNQAAIDAYKMQIPNTASKEEFVKSALIDIIKDKVRRHRAAQHDASNVDIS